MKFTMTDHASSRLAQRLTITASQLIDAITNKSIVFTEFGDGQEYRLFFSIPDNKAFVAISNAYTHEILSIVPALHCDGTPSIFKADKMHRNQTATIAPWQLIKAMKMAGIAPMDIDDPACPVFFKKKPASLRPLDWLLYYENEAGKIVIRRVKHQAEIDTPPDEVPESVLEKIKKILDTYGCTDARLRLIHKRKKHCLATWLTNGFTAARVD
jgi:hypothetical protein